MAKDLANEISVATTLAPAARTAGGNGSTVDLNQNNAAFGSAALVAVVGTITDGTHGLVVEDSPDGSAWSAVSAGNLVGSFVNLASNINQEISYMGGKRYVRVNNTASGTTTGAVFSVVVVRGNPRSLPV